MIRYRRLYESSDSDVSLYDVVSCAGYEWYVIGIDGDVVTLLAKNEDFGRHEFDSCSNKYKNSDIRYYLLYNVLPKLQKANPIPTELSDVGVTDKVWLLSEDEAKDLLSSIRRFDFLWWLRYRGWRKDAANILDDGREGYLNPYNPLAVRPAMKVRIEDLD